MQSCKTSVSFFCIFHRTTSPKKITNVIDLKFIFTYKSPTVHLPYLTIVGEKCFHTTAYYTVASDSMDCSDEDLTIIETYMPIRANKV